MTLADKIKTVKVLVDDSTLSDEVTGTYLNIAGTKIIARAYPFDDSIVDVPERYDNLQCEIAAYLINKRGAEGETSHSENGISRSYENADIPESLMSQIIPKAKVVKL